MCPGSPMQITTIDGYTAHCVARGVVRDASLLLLQDGNLQGVITSWCISGRVRHSENHRTGSPHRLGAVRQNARGRMCIRNRNPAAQAIARHVAVTTTAGVTN